MTRSAPEWLAPALVGARLVGVEVGQASWWGFAFERDCMVATSALWRLVTDRGIAVSSEDHAQAFGLSEPVDAARRALELLPAPVRAVEVSPVTSDLSIWFDRETRLEFLNTSSGYESWHFSGRTHEGPRELIAMGGRGLAGATG